MLLHLFTVFTRIPEYKKKSILVDSRSHHPGRTDMKLLTTALAVLLCSAAFNQTIIKLEDVPQHVGDSVTVCGKVYSARYMDGAKNKPTFLNVGAAYPNQVLTVVIWDTVRQQFNGKPEALFANKEICITGRIELYNNKPQIVIDKPEKIVCKSCN